MQQKVQRLHTLCLYLLFILISFQVGVAKDSATNSPANNPKASLDIEINGIADDAIKKVLMDNITLNNFKEYALTHPAQIPILFRKSEKEIYTLLQPYGYYKPKISTKLTHTESTWHAVFNITLNTPLRITHLEVKVIGPGKDDPIFKTLLANFPLQKGDVLTQAAYEQAKTTLTNQALNAGYLDANLNVHQIRIDNKSYTSTVLLTLDTKGQYRVGKIQLTQKRYDYDLGFIDRITRLKEGEVFTQDKITNANKRLQDSGYFSSAQIIPQLAKRDVKNHLIPLAVNLTAGYSRNYSTGIGYGTFTGPRVSFGTLFRHVTDTGQQFSFNIQASPANSTFQTSYIFPGEDPLHDNWSINAQQSYTQTDSFDERQTNFGVGRMHKYGDWKLTFGIQQYFTSYTTAANSTNERSKYLVPGFTIRYDTTQKDGFWKNGFIWNNVFQVSVNSPFSDQSFIRNAATLTYTFPLDKNWNRVVLNGNFGAIDVDNIQDIAPNFRFYSGGIGNLLGYPYLSQGPKVNGNVTGGKYLATGLVGIEQRIVGNFSTLLYYNLGNATNDLDFHDVEILKAAGIGLSYQTPLGPLMFFLSRTLNQNDRHWRVDFSIGITL
ncbi:autotransporter assembly complex protein TamA [Fangia hongkongensis]|uniref:autotransporter assembly complex protein TamA n=1 Tax=Fangia hongkongensis TaxID=270495 RepID=UPI001969C7C2|nr:BamA/TamA family outer membrane protein [Fangia hongkongensis]